MAKASSPPLAKRQFVVLAVFLVALYVLIPQVKSFHESFHLLSRPRPLFFVLALTLTAGSYFAAAFTYQFLARKPLRYDQTLLVQLASVFVNRLVPGGLGALGVNFAYLRQRQHSLSQATAVVAVNNLLGFVGHMLILTILLLASAGDSHLPTKLPTISPLLIGGVLGIMAIVIGLVVSKRAWRQKVGMAVKDIVRQLSAYRRQPQKLLLALLSSMSLTLATVGCLWLCLLAVHAHIGAVPVLLVFTFGLSVGVATPTPGGLGGFEAGLVAGLLAYDIPSAMALAGVLLFRLLTYWLGIAIGAVAFVICQRRGLFSR